MHAFSVESTELIRRSTWDKNSDSQRSSHSSQNAAESVQDCSAIVSMVYLVQVSFSV